MVKEIRITVDDDHHEIINKAKGKLSYRAWILKMAGVKDGDL